MRTSSLLSLLLTACTGLWGHTPNARGAAPTLTSLFPAGVQQGTTAELTAAGNFNPWPVQAWVDGKGIEVKAVKDKGKLSVSVGPEVPPGVHWLRLYNEQGASAPRPFVVGTLAEVLEQEPNDDPKKPHVLES